MLVDTVWGEQVASILQHGIISQETNVSIFLAVRNSNPVTWESGNVEI
jgi:hypothetical protein